MFTNYNVEALGWGMTSFGGPASNVLKKAKLRVITDKECRKYFPIHSSQMCTYAAGNDTCQVPIYKLYIYINISLSFSQKKIYRWILVGHCCIRQKVMELLF